MTLFLQSIYIILFFTALFASNVYANHANGEADKIRYSYHDKIIMFDKINISFEVFDKSKKQTKKCYPDNYSESSDNGFSFLTNDHEAIVFQSSGRFILTADVINKCDSQLSKDAKVYPAVNVGIIVDMNFKKKIALVYHYFPGKKTNMDKKDVYLAEVSRFFKSDYTSDVSLYEVDPKKVKYYLSGKYFYSGNYDNAILNGYIDSLDFTSGIISPDAKYVDPFGLGCDVNKIDSSRPGVYEIATGKRVIFNLENRKSKEDVSTKCRLLLNGTETLQKLGGYLRK